MRTARVTTLAPAKAEHCIGRNRELWERWTGFHVASDHYDVKGFLAGRGTLQPFEADEVGEVAGRSLIHLQCHFGLDTLSWARRGARVTGVDFSPRAIARAGELARATAVPAEFLCSEVYGLPAELDGRFDIVYVSFGSVVWLPDIARWARAAARLLAPGGVLYVAEYHPVLHTLDFDDATREPVLRYPYFDRAQPIAHELRGTYADSADDVTESGYTWAHSLGAIVTSVLDAGLRLDFLHEFPSVWFPVLPYLERRADGRYWLPERVEGELPLLFSLRATRPGVRP
ncbi:class I SAM-dependent methyltransferase [Streptomyces sp. SDr-06]|uniref:class I SAM-dependent methyltransferase n=1 Tax=Streptomyces sp. SDr-06 TaxID=2267702 RepID=UPI000DE9CACC|nr:class I SAM-dependent methyltransferase [Streptomyces sp. SDr-06]RCH67536.1 class I SAM-dependent methyltransferase [Streptomyces sp. SDr-06]